MKVKLGACSRSYTLDVQTNSHVNSLHVNIFDTARTQFTVPTDIVNPPGISTGSSKSTSELVFNYDSNPFAFWITRRSQPDATPLFDTRITSLPRTPIPPVRDDKSTTFEGFPMVYENGYIQVCNNSLSKVRC
jgi:alpha-glucosidase